MTDLKPGWTVVASDGQRVGTVKEVSQNYLRTSRSALSSDLYVPASAIANVTEGVVHLSVTHRDVGEIDGLGPAPRTDDHLETSPEANLKRHI